MKFVNATPHTLNMFDTFNPATDRVEDYDLHPCGDVVRVTETLVGGPGSAGIVDLALGDVVGWPEDIGPDDYVVVSRPALMAMLAAGDPRCSRTVVVGKMHRDGEGRIVGASGWAMFQ